MDEVFSGLVVLFGLMLIVYALDAAAARWQARAPRIRQVATVAGLLTALGASLMAGWLFQSGEQVSPWLLGLVGGGAVLTVVALPAARSLFDRAFPPHEDEGRFEVGLVVLLWLVIFRLVEYYSVDQSFEEVGIAAAAIQTFALLGVAAASIGFLTRRRPRATLARLGLDRITSRSIWVGVSLVIPLIIFGSVSVLLVDWLSPGSSERLADTVEQITGGETGLGYALALGIFAAAGEETLFRGALQPKYGLVLTSLIFALLHVQYDLLLVVASLFPVGLILGLERKYLGTVACIVTHALYNTLAVALG